MNTLRTPEDRFVATTAAFPYAPRYVEVSDSDGGALRVATYQAGPGEGSAILLLHGEPSWSYLYRHVMARLAERGLHSVAVDLVGFGRSDKPAEVADHSYARHVAWVREAVADRLGLTGVTLVGQDWGGLIGLRLATENPGLVDRIVAANTGLPTGDQAMPEVWLRFREAVRTAPELDVGRFVGSGCKAGLSDADRAAYDAPFPDEASKAGPRAMPGLVPTTPDDPASEANRTAWQRLTAWDRPFLVAFSDGDPITGAMAGILRSVVPAAAAEPEITLTGGHFLQEDCGLELADAIADFVQRHA
ncbi:MAG TPA: haloalkane dehalogenase [Mycobacteriales bacterium]|nr:haloalkane dehalogenase [Mycobacteriales bacterium]